MLSERRVSLIKFHFKTSHVHFCLHLLTIMTFSEENMKCDDVICLTTQQCVKYIYLQCGLFSCDVLFQRDATKTTGDRNIKHKPPLKTSD